MKLVDDLGIAWFRFWGWAVGKPKSLNTIHLLPGYQLTRWPREKGEWWRGTLSKKDFIITYDQGLDPDFFWKPGELHSSAEKLEDYREDIWNGQKVRLGRFVQGSAPSYCYQITFEDVPITFTAWIKEPWQEDEMRRLLSTYQGRQEYFIWMPDRLVDFLHWWVRDKFWLKWHLLKVLVVVAVLAPAFLFFHIEDRKPFPGKENFKILNSQITTDEMGHVGYGETSGERDLARKYSAHFQPAYDRERGGKFSLMGSINLYHPVVYCRRGDGVVVFLCHASGLDFDQVRNLGEAAWTAAVAVAREEHFQEETELVVGLRSLGLYQVVHKGRATGLPSTKKDIRAERDLYPYFLEAKPPLIEGR